MEAAVAVMEDAELLLKNDSRSPQMNMEPSAVPFNANTVASSDVDAKHENGAVAAEGSEEDSAGIENSDNEAPWYKQANVNPFSNKSLNGPPAAAAFRGRGGGNFGAFGRGGGRGAGNFAARGPYEQNWAQNQPPNNRPAPAAAAGSNAAQLELWVETKTEDSKSYFYNALTRETTWNKPEGPNVKIMTQAEIEDMNKKQQQQQQAPAAAEAAAKATDEAAEPETAAPAAVTTQPPPNLLSQPPPNTQQPPPMSQPPPNTNAASTLTQQPPPGMHQQPPPFFQPGGMHPPPNFSQPPFGMPPPGFGGYPGTHWGMGGGPGAPWNQQQQHMHAPPGMAQQQAAEKPAKNLIIKPGVIDPAVIARAAEWSEHRAPDGRPYYYHAQRGESVWEKPQALRDMEAARMAAHSGATPQQAVAAPPVNTATHLMPNHMLHMAPVAGGFDATSMAYNAAAVAAHAAAAAAAAVNIKANESTKANQTANLEKEAKRFAEEKRKKDEEQKKSASATAAASKPVDKSRPVSSTPIAGTPWCVVWTGDARVFFYNPSTRTSVWERPEELLDRTDVDKAVSTAPEQLRNTAAGSSNATNSDSKSSDGEDTKKAKIVAEVEEEQKPVATTDDDEIIKIRTESESSVEEVPTKKSKLGE